MKASLPVTEPARLDALHEYEILDTPPDRTLDDLVRLAGEICETPIALVSLVDQERQWCKAKLGIEVCEIPREQSFCAHAILDPFQPLVVGDAQADPRFRDNEFVAGSPGIRFYAGFPLVTPGGHALGTLCVIDTRPRQLSGRQTEVLRILARQVMTQFELRRSLREMWHANETACRREAQFAEAQRISRTGSWHWDISGDTLSWSDETYRLLGHPPQSFSPTARLCLKNLAPRSRKLFRDRVKKALEEKVPFEFETRGRLASSGEVRILHLTGDVIRDATDRPVEMLGTIRDVTDARNAETTLREQKDLLQSIYEGVEEAIFVVDVDVTGEFHFAGLNPAHERLFGLDAGGARSQTPGQLAGRIPPHVIAAIRANYERCLRSERGIEHEETLPVNGREVCVLTRLSSVRNAEGRIHRIIGTSIDITARKRAETALQKARAAAEAANADLAETNRQMEESIHRANRLALAAEAASRAKSEFLATMSHEIRTPMNGVIGFTGLLAESALTPEQREQVEIIRSSGETLLALINDILDFSKIEAGRIEIERIEFDIADAVQQTLAVLRTRAAAKNLELKAHLHESVPPIVVGDVTRLRQILLNLAGNAIKFTERGGVTLEIRRCELPVAGRSRAGSQPPASSAGRGEPFDLHFTIRDTGIGIPPERLNRLFKAFSQVDSSTTRRYGGTGLGLAISKKLCELMGGGIHVESTPGFGSAFHFTVQVDLAAHPAGTSQAPSNTDAPAGNAASLPPRPLRVLLAEDNRVNQALATALLKKAGCTVTVAANGAECLEILKQQPFDVVFMDVCMPGIDGYETTRRIRSGESGARTARIYIAAMTANALEGDRERCLSSGMDDYLAKPLNKQELLASLRRAGEHDPDASPGPAWSQAPATPTFDPRSF